MSETHNHSKIISKNSIRIDFLRNSLHFAKDFFFYIEIPRSAKGYGFANQNASNGMTKG